MRNLYTDERAVSPVVAVLLLLAIFIGAYAVYMAITIPGEFAFKEKEHMSEVRDSFLRLQRTVKNMSEQGAQSVYVSMSAELFSGSVRGPSIGGTLNTRASFVDHTTIGCWLMDEGSGDNVYDETRYQNHGVNYGATWVPGPENVGRALSFDGIGDYVNCGNDESLNVTTGITLQAWIYWEGSAFDGRIANKSKGGADRAGYMLLVDSANKIKFRLGNGAFTTLETIQINLNQWYHVSATWSTNDGKMRIYVDGQESTSGNFTGTISSTTVPFIIGKAPDSDEEYFNGIIDSVMVYNRAWSGEEIRALYENRANYYGAVDFDIKNTFYSPQRYVYEDGAVILVQDNKNVMSSMPYLLTVEDRESNNVEVRLRTVRVLGYGETSGVGAAPITVVAENFNSTPVTSTPNLENLTIVIYSQYRDAWKSYLLWLAENYLYEKGIHAAVDFQNLQLTLYGKNSMPGINDIYLVREYREVAASLF